MKISIFGLGYVGAVSLACLARDGHTVIGVDVDENKLALLREGKSPIVEAGIQELTSEVMRSGRVDVTVDHTRAIHESDLSFVCVGTPSLANGGQDLSAIQTVCGQIGQALATKSDPHTIVIRSTVQPGTTWEEIRPTIEAASDKEASRDFHLCFQPEFLREGSSIRDYDQPPVTVVGCDHSPQADILRELFGHLPCEFVTTDIRTAELLKYACNAFHALKIAFANEIGRLANALGQDSRRVMALLCKDKQLNISDAYLRPGFAFGGSCLPKDLRALNHFARRSDILTPVLENIIPSNDLHIQHAVDMILARGRPKTLLVGLSFKEGTDDLRESPMVRLAEALLGKGIPIQIYDPHVQLSRLIGANRRYIERVIPHLANLIITDLQQTIADVEIVVVACDDPVLRTVFDERDLPDKIIIDLVGLDYLAANDCEYRGIGW